MRNNRRSTRRGADGRCVEVWRWARRILLGLCSLILLAAIAGTAYQWVATRRDLKGTPAPGRLVDIGSHRLHLWCTGDGAPTVVLDSGLGGSSVDWGFVQPDVARFTRVCSYDRAGMGYSEAGPSPRTARRIASELAELLKRASVGGPFVLVGGSSGGLNMRVFASDYPDHVAGLVLVDASHENQHHEVPSLAPFVPLLSTIGAFRLLDVSFSLPVASLAPSVQPFARATKFRTAGYQAAASEIAHFAESAEEVRRSRRKLTVPLIVVTSGNDDVTWGELQRDQVTLSERGCQIVAEESGHVVPIDQPRIVVDAIRRVVEAARGQLEAGNWKLAAC